MQDATTGDGARDQRLPAAGWLPDPSDLSLERYWNGGRWTSRTRDRVTRIETGVAPRTYARRKRRGPRRFLVAVMSVALLVAGLGWVGMLPEWVPYSETLNRSAPAGPDVAYPVFGSDDLVRYLARAMIAQEESIDVSYWVQVAGFDAEDINAAMLEALTQNPYAFADRWTQTITLVNPEITPEYIYDRAEAERRRKETSAAVATALEITGAASAPSDEAKAALINDYLAAHATYDHEAFEASQAFEPGSGGKRDLRTAQSQEAYGLLVAGTAVCNGYSQAFQLLADAAGLDSVIVTGIANGGVYSGLHAWNRVNIDGEWLVVDVTWNDTDTEAPPRDFFLIADGDPMLSTRSVGDTWVVPANRGAYA